MDTVAPGASRQLIARIRDASGGEMTGQTATWSSSDTAIATVAAGTVTGKREGVATVTASAGGKSGTASIVVRVPAAKVVVSPTSPRLFVGATQQFTATVQDTAGTTLAQRVVTWKSSDTTIAKIDSVTGRLTAVARGTATITATHAGVSGTATVAIDPPIAAVKILPGALNVVVGGTRQMTAVALTAAGDTVVGHRPVWSSAQPAIATIGDSSGVLTGVALGTVNISATVGSTTATMAVVVGRPVETIVVSPSGIELGVGAVRPLTAMVRDVNGAQILGRALAWSSSDTAIAKVDSAGVVKGIALGSTTVLATSEGRADTVPVVVKQGVASLRIAPDTLVIGQGASRRLAVIALATNGDTVAGRTPSWSSSSTGAVSVASDGTITGNSPGTATITARIDSTIGTAHVTVGNPVATVTLPPNRDLPIGRSFTATAVLRDAAGTVLNGRLITWQSNDTSRVKVDAKGVITGTGLGIAYVMVVSEGKAAQMMVNVIPTPIASVTVTPNPATLRRYEELQLTAVLKDSAGNVLTGRDVSWVSSRPGYVTVSATGLLKGIYPDTASILVQAENARTTVPVRIEAPTPVASVTIAPSPATVKLYETLELTATLKDAAGNVLPERQMPWTSTNPAIATVNEAGFVTPVAQGTTTITAGGASTDGKVGSVTLTVAAPTPIATITMNPSSLRLVRGTETGIAVALRDAAGNELIGRPITWTSSNPSIATVTSVGTVRGVALGKATITAASGGRTATAIVDVVLPAPVATVRIFPDTATREIGDTLQLLAVAYDSTGIQLPGRALTWSSSSTARATVSATGPATAKLTALTAGAVTITATSEGKSGTAAVTITPASAATIAVTPNPVALAVDDSVTLTATVKDARGTVLTGRTVTWTSDSPSLAFFSRPGVLRSIALGSGTFTVTSDGKSVQVPFTVTAQPVGTVMIEPNPVVAFVGLEVPTQVDVFARNGQKLNDRPVTYRTLNPAVATVAANGVVRGVAIGSTGLIASSEDVSDTTEIFVESSRVDTIIVKPVNPRARVGETILFTAEMYNAEGSLLPTRPVRWTSSDYLVGYAMDSLGTYYARQGGASRITGTYTRPDGSMVAGSSLLTVETQAPTVAEVLVEPNPVNLSVGQVATLSVIPLDANRQVIYGLSGLTFRSDNTAVATVSSSGGIVARGGGTTKVWATIGGGSGYTTVNVTGSSSGGGGGSGGGGSGGGGSGGGSGGGTCNSTVSIATPAPGQTSAWVRLPYPSKLEVRVRSSSTNYGTASAPRYEYFFTFRNGYTQRIYFGYGASTEKVQTSTTYSVSVDAGATESELSIYGPRGTLSLYVSGARLGDFSAPTFCE